MILSAHDYVQFLNPRNVRDASDLPQIRWKSPQVGVLKLNVDGSFNAASNLMCTGGLLRDSKGEWSSGFSSIEGSGDALLVELLAVKNRLNYAWEEDARVVQCESDSADVVSLLMRQTDLSYHVHGRIIADIQHLLRRDWNIRLDHVLREANMEKDFLAKNAVNMTSWWKVWRDPPPLLRALLLQDSLGCSS